MSKEGVYRVCADCKHQWNTDEPFDWVNADPENKECPKCHSMNNDTKAPWKQNG
jgi:hypothetical protein